jgi:hypothetical protein
MLGRIQEWMQVRPKFDYFSRKTYLILFKFLILKLYFMCHTGLFIKQALTAFSGENLPFLLLANCKFCPRNTVDDVDADSRRVKIEHPFFILSSEHT